MNARRPLCAAAALAGELYPRLEGVLQPDQLLPQQPVGDHQALALDLHLTPLLKLKWVIFGGLYLVFDLLIDSEIN